MTDQLLPIFEDVVSAAWRLRGIALETPLLHAPVLDAAVGARVFLKAETLQRTGSFKFRGAYNKLSQIPAGARAAGVVAYSSGNHAQGVASAASLLAMPATIVMPADAPAVKRERVLAAGAEIVDYDRVSEDREAIARSIAEARGAVLVPPFDDPHIIAGQGTVGVEILTQSQAAIGAVPDMIVVPCSGGGLVSGISLVASELMPACRVLTAEPEGFDDMARSLAAGARRRNERLQGSICDALMSPEPGEITFAVAASRLAGGVAVDDAQVKAAMVFAFRELKLVLEPGGAVALAALLAGRVDHAGGTVIAVLSGANVDPALFCDVVGAKP